MSTIKLPKTSIDFDIFLKLDELSLGELRTLMCLIKMAIKGREVPKV